MQIIECIGHELEKEQPNTSEDFFNRSVVRFVEDGVEKTFHLLYIRYFDEMFTQFTPFKQDPIFKFGEKEIFFRDIVGIVCLIKNPAFRDRKRAYINNQREFEQYFSGINYEMLQELVQQVTQNGSYDLSSPLLLIEQP
ncbi:hypothetical protein ACOI1C_04720 [Bacillus sp. DJP31]|uniref:hypothetical protein n=1 Tax=Bacillus sp. DJP31 TaxID=3409789 RepID=UPI003BB80A8C